MARFLRDRYLWLIAALLSISGILIYAVESYLLSGIPSGLEQRSTYMTWMTFRSVLLLIAVVIAAWRFGVKGGLAIAFLIGLILAPHIIDEMAEPLAVNTLALYGIWGAIGVIFSWLVGSHKQAEEALRESEERHRHTLDNMLEGCQIIGYNWRYLYVNDAVARHGHRAKEELLGHTMMEMYPGIEDTEMFAYLRRCMEKRIPHHMENEFAFPDGSKGWFELSIQPMPEGIFILSEDITGRKQTEERQAQLQQELYLSGRLAAIGELAAGVAHEINNPLTGIIGFSQRLMRKSTDEKAREDLETIHNAGLRAAKVVENLLTFARRRKVEKEYADVNDILKKALDLRAYELKTSNIKVITDLVPSLPRIMVDFQQIEEVFLNIILNAEQAMTEAKGRGKLSIKTQKTKGYIRVSFADDGPGISAEHLDKLFDTFFTTRGDKGGTGLGLSICHGIITEHGGKLYAKSKPGEGATFFIELPLTTEKTGKSKAAEEVPA